MNKAKEFMEREQMTCKEAAEQSGYVDYVQFSKMFKKYIGMTPSYFLKNSINTSKDKI